MGRALLFLLILGLLIYSFNVLAVENTVQFQPNTVQFQPNTAPSDTQNQLYEAIMSLERDILDGVNANNDLNMKALDDRTTAMERRIIEMQTSSQQKTIIGSIGATILVAGIVYFFLIRSVKDTSYESINLKRKKEIEDRQWMADNINYMRERMEAIDANMKDFVQPTLFTLEQLAEQRKREQADFQSALSQHLMDELNKQTAQRRNDDGRSVYTGGQAGGGYGANSEPIQQQFGAPVAQQGYVQGLYGQPPQGWVPDGNQYEQPAGGQGRYGPVGGTQQYYDPNVQRWY